MSETAFYALAIPTVASAAGVVALRNPVHCAMSLVLSLFLIAVQYVTLDAHLVAALQIIVYAGAVMILFLFVIMLLNLQVDEHEPLHVGRRLVGVGTAAAMGLMIASLLWRGRSGAAVPVVEGFGTTESLARVLFREHAVAFELTSLLLLVAVVGAVVLARRERD